MLNPDKTPRQYKYVNPDHLLDDASSQPEHDGTVAEALADGILDIIQAALATGTTHDEVEAAMRRVTEMLALQERFRFRLHVSD